MSKYKRPAALKFSERGVGSLSHIPYLFQFLNCGLWILYGLTPSVSNTSILVTNGVGIVLSTFYLWNYYKFCVEKKTILSHSSFASGFLILVSIVTYLLIYNQAPYVSTLLGVIASIICVIMFGSPLSTIQTVIKTKSTESMPVLMCMLGTACSCSWLIYGSILSDIFIWLPNLGGFFLGLLQIALLLVYPRKQSSILPTSHFSNTDL